MISHLSSIALLMDQPARRNPAAKMTMITDGMAHGTILLALVLTGMSSSFEISVDSRFSAKAVMCAAIPSKCPAPTTATTFFPSAR